MKEFKLDLDASIRGIYLSTETIELMRIIQCNDIETLKTFVRNCEQLAIRENDISTWKEEELEKLKHEVFEQYKDSLIATEQKVTDREAAIRQALQHLELDEDEIDKYSVIFKEQGITRLKDVLATEHPKEYSKLAKSQHRFIASERDQIKSVTYDEILELIGKLRNHNTILLGSGRYYDITNRMSNTDMEKYDFYHIQRGLEFCQKNGLYARYHTLLDKQTLDNHRAGKDKETVLAEIEAFVKQTIDFINEYNSSHTIKDEEGTERGVITSVDLFNEIISFDPPYVNRWQEEYGIQLEELLQVFQYALDNKPEGVTYVYNEPFLENSERRKEVILLLRQIEEISPGLIDTLGTQMHIETNQRSNDIVGEFRDFKDLQDLGFNIQITEFDMCLPETEIFEEDGTLKQITDDEKQKKIAEITQIISESGVQLEGLTYWSISDTLDHNVERTNTKTFLAKDFYTKFKCLGNTGKAISLEELLRHPFLTKDQAEKFKKLYSQEGGIEKLDKMIRARQREVVTTRLSGLYSGTSRNQNKEQKDETLLDRAIEATEETTMISEINEAAQTIKTVQTERIAEKKEEPKDIH